MRNSDQVFVTLAKDEQSFTFGPMRLDRVCAVEAMLDGAVTVTVTPRCSAVLRHGPGHQSSTPCELMDGHDDDHETTTPRGEWYAWKGGAASAMNL